MSVKDIRKICMTLLIVVVAALVFPAAVFASEDTSIADVTAETTVYESKEDIQETKTSESAGSWVLNEDGTYSFVINGNKLTGFQKIEGNYYLFNEDGIMQKGFHSVDGIKRYFGDDGKMITSSKVNAEGKTYYFDDNGAMASDALVGSNYYDATGAMVKNAKITISGFGTYYFDDKGYMVKDKLVKIGNHDYYFKSTGLMAKNAKITIAGTGTYYFDDKGYMVKNKLVKIGKYHYYFKSTGLMVKGTTAKIGSSYYLFSTDGKRYTTTGLKTVGNKKYYVISKSGKVSTKGWQAVVVKSGKKQYKRAYYCSPKNGTIAKKGTKIGALKIPGKGYLGEAYYYGVKTLDKNGWSLKSAFNYSKKLKYYGRSYRAKYVETYAVRGFKTKKGNCYVMAATFTVQAKLLGYDIKQVYGKVDLPHSWTEIKHNNRTYVYDPNFTNETGRNGYKIYYGKKGTWRYHKSGTGKHSY